jgi:hypothetical protein
LRQSLFSSPVKAFELPVYVGAMADAYVIAEPNELSPVRFKGDARVSKYMDISAAEDAVVLESSSVGGNQRSSDSSLRSSSTCSISSTPSSRKSTTDYEDSSECSHSCDDSVASDFD